jgi:GNAT superfamily N-acetyltransferase
VLPSGCLCNRYQLSQSDLRPDEHEDCRSTAASATLVNMPLRLSIFVGRDMAALLPDLARLCTIVFREWPHLYDGDGRYDLGHLQALVASPRAALIIAYDDDRPVGASTCLPLVDATANVQAPFLERHLPLKRFFYFAGSVLLRPYRGHGTGTRFFALREAHARTVSDCDFVCFCTIQRPDHHPLRPIDTKPLDVFWRRQGYVPAPDLRCTMTWREIGKTRDSQIPLLFWLKPLTSSGLQITDTGNLLSNR